MGLGYFDFGGLGFRAYQGLGFRVGLEIEGFWV